VVPGPAPAGQKVGGMAFGYCNPFATVWGIRDRDSVLWQAGERYGCQQPWSHHARFLPACGCWRRTCRLLGAMAPASLATSRGVIPLT
jgi:hypothetical protein